jgi:hypothetical protein
MPNKPPRANKGRANTSHPRALSSTTILAQHKHGTVMSGEALGFLFHHWLERQMKEMRDKLTSAEAASMAHADLQSFLRSLTETTDTVLPRTIDHAVDRQIARMFPRSQQQYDETMRANTIKHDQDSISALRAHLHQWSQVEGEEIMLVFLSEDSLAAGEGKELLEGLRRSPNRAFTWRLLFPSIGLMSNSLAAFRQQLWVNNFEFINNCISDLGRPLPIMELGELFRRNDNQDMLEQTCPMHFP